MFVGFFLGQINAIIIPVENFFFFCINLKMNVRICRKKMKENVEPSVCKGVI